MKKTHMDKILKALLGKKSDYEKVRSKVIKEKGYDYFKAAQLRAFKKLNVKLK